MYVGGQRGRMRSALGVEELAEDASTIIDDFRDL